MSRRAGADVPKRHLLVALATTTTSAVAAPNAAATPSTAPSQVTAHKQQASPRAPAPWPQAAAVVPGFLLHGAGPWLQGRNQTAARLLWWELASIGLTFGAGTGLALSGAARDIVGPLALAGASGVTLFGASFLAGLYAVSAPAEGFGAAAPSPLMVTSVGYRFVSDAQFSAPHYAHTSVDALVGAVHLGLHTAVAPAQGADSVGTGEFRALVGYRVLGEGAPGAARETRRLEADNTHLEVQAALGQERFVANGFSSYTYEAALSGRLDLKHYLPDVRGAFLQGLAGYARQTTDFELPQVRASDTRSLLLAHLGFGVYLSHPALTAPTGRHGEVELYYDHRHDGRIAGLKVYGLGSGVAGHLGLRTRYFLAPPLGLEVRGEFGSAASVSLSMLYRIETPNRAQETE